MRRQLDQAQALLHILSTDAGTALSDHLDVSTSQQIPNLDLCGLNRWVQEKSGRNHSMRSDLQ